MGDQYLLQLLLILTTFSHFFQFSSFLFLHFLSYSPFNYKTNAIFIRFVIKLPHIDPLRFLSHPFLSPHSNPNPFIFSLFFNKFQLFLSLILSIKQMKLTKFNLILSLIKQKLLLIILFLPFNFLHFFSFLSFHFLLPCYKTQFLIFLRAISSCFFLKLSINYFNSD